MPELKRTFLKGRMNQDLDERLLPIGEYFDATNIQVSTSEGSDVGAIETILGNTQQLKRKSNGDLWTAGFGLSSPKCIGGTRDAQNNKIYWFVVDSAGKSAILEYDEATSIVAVVIADIRTGDNQVLGFNTSNLITGINIIDDMLFFTDNLNEPRKINISTFKASPTNTGDSVATIDATTTLSNPKILNNKTVFTAEDINVIKKAPKAAPKMTLFSSLIGNGDLPGTGIAPMVTQSLNFSSLSGATGATGFPSFAQQTLTFTDENITGQYVQKEVELRARISNFETGESENYVIRGTVTRESSTQLTLTPKIVPQNIPDQSVPWELLIIEKDFIYKREFPRFAYRWKYNDGEYSSISPFTEPAFVPGKYNYQSMDAENEGMLNHLRKIKLEFEERTTDYGPPRSVEYVEVLYKSSKSNNIYVIKTAELTQPGFEFDPTASGPSDLGTGGVLNTGGGDDLNNNSSVGTPSGALVAVDGEFKEFNITEELDGPILDSSQLLRLFDTVPKKALAQEIIANRIVYGNYTEGYDENSDPIVFDTKLFSTTSNQDLSGANVQDLIGSRSIKSDKTYQLGVAFLDEFNRESPVLTNDNAVINVPKNKSHFSNFLKASIKNTAPSWAKFYKYYVKDNYSEEYNLLLDRFYDAEDGNFWLSFPSAERNKIAEKDIIVLKKKHGETVPVNIDNEYKVIDIKNQPPEGLKLNNLDIIARAPVAPIANGTDIVPGFAGGKKLVFDGPGERQNNEFFKVVSTARALQFANPKDADGADKEILSKIYKIESAGTNDFNSAVDATKIEYNITLKEGITSGDASAFGFENSGLDQAADRVEIILYGDDSTLGLEYEGRFFVKVEKRASFHEDVIAPSFASLAGLAVRLKTPKSITENIQTNPPNATYPAFKTQIDGTTITKASTLKTTRPWRFQGAGLVYDSNNPVEIFRDKKLAEIGFTINSDNPTGEAVPTNGGTTFSVVYGPIDADIDKVSSVFEAMQIGAKIRFADGNKVGDIYTITNITNATTTGAGSKFKYKTITIDRGYVVATIAAADIDGIQILQDSTRSLLVENPAVFEIKSEKNVDLDIYYEASDALPISNLANETTLKYSNCIAFKNGVESTRVADDFNKPIYGKGVRVSSILKKAFKEETRQSDLIFSGIINSRTDINNSNQFIIAENITKSINPRHGSIQKLFARDGELLTLCEDKCFQILADKDALFNADGNAQLTATNNVLGQVVPFAGEFGISKNPESFVSYGFRSYFTDKSRGAVIRLSRNGLTEISEQGLSNYFEDNFKATTNPLSGSYDESNGSYNLRVDSEQVAYDEGNQGWCSKLSYAPEFALSLNNNYYSFKNGSMWKHDNATRANFYGTQRSTDVTVIFNDAPSSIKHYKTVFYEGDSGWTVDLETNAQTGITSGALDPGLTTALSSATFKEKEGKYYNFITGDALTWDNGESESGNPQPGNLDTAEFAIQGIATMAAEASSGDYATTTPGIRFAAGVVFPNSLQLDDQFFYMNNSTSKIYKLGKVTAIDQTNLLIRVERQGSFAGITLPTSGGGDFAFFAKDTIANTSGIAGYFNKAKFTNTGTSKNELFTVGTEVFISS